MNCNYKKFKRLAPCNKCHGPFWVEECSGNLDNCTDLAQGSESYFNLCMKKCSVPYTAKEPREKDEVCMWFPASFTYDNRF